MEEETTTPTPQGAGIEETQPATTEPVAAATEASTTEEKPTAPSETVEPSEDEQLADWAKNKGLDLDSDSAKKAAKMAREAERAMHQKSQKASELERSMNELSDIGAESVASQTGENPEVLKRVQRMEVRDALRDFFDARPDAKAYEQQMITVLSKGDLVGTPEAVLNAAYGIALSEDTGAVKSQARRETLESLAQKQQAAVPTGNATNKTITSSATITPETVDELVAKNDVEWYKKNLDAINDALAA